MYPADSLAGYSREQFIDDLLAEHEIEIRRCRAKGAYKVQIDFTEARFAMKIDASGRLLHGFIDLNNLALSRFSADERKRIGVHTCPGGDLDSTHSADVDYAELLPSLFPLKVGHFYIALAGEGNREHGRVGWRPRSTVRPGPGLHHPIARSVYRGRACGGPACRGGAMREGVDFDMEFRVLGPDGSVRWIHNKAKTFLDDHGYPLYMTGACADITSRKEAAAARRENEQRLQAMFNQAAVGIAVAALDGRFLDMHRKFSDILGYSPADSRPGSRHLRR